MFFFPTDTFGRNGGLIKYCGPSAVLERLQLTLLLSLGYFIVDK